MSDQKHTYALPAGTVIAGYEIVRVLGVGGFGITYEGINPVTRRRAAIKEFFPRGIASRENATRVMFSDQDKAVVSWALERFRRSTAELSGLKHPNIVDVLNYVSANETGYMFMEQIEGETLDNWLQTKGASLTFAELSKLIVPLCEALEYVHSRKFIHRDVAPDNIMVRKDGSPILIDFGAIKIIAQHTQTRAASTLSYGVAKQHYSPPEQLDENAQLDPRADIYALAAVIYRAVTGVPPADALKRNNALLLNGVDPYVPVTQAARMVLPAGVAEAIDRALSLRPAERPFSIAELLAGLFGSDMPGEAETFRVIPHPMPVPGFSSLVQTPRAVSRAWYGAAAIAAAIVVVLSGFLLQDSRRQETAVGKQEIATKSQTKPVPVPPTKMEAPPKTEPAPLVKPDAPPKFVTKKQTEPKQVPQVLQAQDLLAGIETPEQARVRGLQLALNDDRRREALAFYTEAIRRFPRNAELYVGRADVHNLDNNVTAAIIDYSEAISLNPKELDYLRARAGSYLKRGSLRKTPLTDLFRALEDLDFVIRNADRSDIYERATDHYRRGSIYEKLVELGADAAYLGLAKEDFLTAIRINPPHSPSHEALLRILPHLDNLGKTK